MSRARRKTPSLHMEERAIIRTLIVHGDEATVSKHYATALDLSSQGLQIYSITLFPVGEVLEIDIDLQGHGRAHTLKGVARSVTRSDDAAGYVIDVDLVADNNAATWRKQFH